jgi:hypothetical protein
VVPIYSIFDTHAHIQKREGGGGGGEGEGEWEGVGKGREGAEKGKESRARIGNVERAQESIPRNRIRKLM